MPSIPGLSSRTPEEPKSDPDEPVLASHGGPGWRAWSRRRKIILAVVALLVVALALGLGLGIGLSRSSDDDDSEADSDPQTTPRPGGNDKSAADGPKEIWRPPKGVDWQIVLHSALNDTSADVPVYDIDLFTNDEATFKTLHDLGRKVICYFSAGSYESYRPDSGEFTRDDYGNPLEGWENEWWINTKSANVRRLMRERLDLAARKGCDGVDPDNIDGYDNDTGLGLTEDDAVDFVGFLADEAHKRNLAIGLKNGGAIVDRVLEKMEWEVNEQCVEYDECEDFRPFIDAGKPVFHIEYPSEARRVSDASLRSICSRDTVQGFSTLVKELELGNWYRKCERQYSS